MASRKNYTPHLATLPGKQWMYRLTLVMLVTGGLVLVAMSRAENPAAVKLRTSITDALLPVLAVAASPFDAVHNASAWITEMADLRAQNIALKNQNLQLLQWQALAKNTAQENESLRRLLGVIPAQKHTFITARVVSGLGGPYVHSALLAGGRENGIRKDQAVVNEFGLAGRVIDVGEKSARVLLLSDINSRVPVVAENAREKGILTGGSQGLLTLSYLAANSHIEEGDRLVTSGDGGIFPPGIPVGIVTGIDKGTVTVQPFVDPAQMEYVNVFSNVYNTP